MALFAASADNVAWYLGRMGKRTIGGDKINQLRHVRFLRDTDGLLALMDRHRAIVAPEVRDASSTPSNAHLGGTGVASWTVPKGGYFISLDVLDGCAKEVVRLAKEAGVELTPAGATHPLAAIRATATSASRRRSPSSRPSRRRPRAWRSACCVATSKRLLSS